VVLPAQPVAEQRSVVPGNVHYRLVFHVQGLPAHRAGAVFAPPLPELAVGDFVRRQVERPLEADVALGFVGAAAGFTPWGAHGECGRRAEQPEARADRGADLRGPAGPVGLLEGQQADLERLLDLGPRPDFLGAGCVTRLADGQFVLARRQSQSLAAGSARLPVDHHFRVRRIHGQLDSTDDRSQVQGQARVPLRFRLHTARRLAVALEGTAVFAQRRQSTLKEWCRGSPSTLTRRLPVGGYRFIPSATTSSMMGWVSVMPALTIPAFPGLVAALYEPRGCRFPAPGCDGVIDWLAVDQHPGACRTDVISG
jgi:hypothetical protein